MGCDVKQTPHLTNWISTATFVSYWSYSVGWFDASSM